MQGWEPLSQGEWHPPSRRRTATHAGAAAYLEHSRQEGQGAPRGEVMAYIQGHSLPDATSGDDYGDRSPLGLAVDSLRFEGMDFAAIRPWAPTERNLKA